MRLARHCTVLLLALTLGACGHGNTPDDQADAGASQAATEAPPPPQAPAAPTAPEPAANPARPLQASDLDAYAKGMQKEIEMRQAASDKAAKAKAANDQTAEITALAELTSVEVTEAGAQAAGVDRARYNFIKDTVDHVLGTSDMNAMMAKMGDAAQAQKMQSDPYAGLEPDLAAALKSRQDELARLRAQNMAVLMNAQKL
ncbi:hypothetical protein ACFWZU_15965 [Frateuria sp. GZRR33]|uniref:hypothetical protein n=1 Tax=Frateuria sp. GZRR33 TaxID=3351535 RepID=UPI003EDBEB33